MTMKFNRLTQPVAYLALSATLLALMPGRGTAQTLHDAVEVLRSAWQADRKQVIAEAMLFTDAESQYFWPIYRDYQADLNEVGDATLKLVVAYAELYPGVSDKRAKELLKEYLRLEEKRAELKTTYTKKFRKVLPAAKLLRYLQLQNRLDLVTQAQLASAIPLMPLRPSRSTAPQP
jgi:hypothetical protein